MQEINTLIWDWNGTLLDDVDICIESINALLGQRNLPLLVRETYRDIFTFPVRNYYVKAGFDFSSESFDQIAMEFIRFYQRKLKKARLHSDVREVLRFFKDQNFTQYIISAMEHDALVKSVSDKNIEEFFREISGIGDHFATSKLENAKQFMEEMKLTPSKTCFIGDTLHDFEVAKELGMYCLLIANGHQSYNRLKGSGCRVVMQLTEVIEIFKQNLKLINSVEPIV